MDLKLKVAWHSSATLVSLNEMLLKSAGRAWPFSRRTFELKTGSAFRNDMISDALEENWPNQPDRFGCR